jgi:hypothetical protein
MKKISYLLISIILIACNENNIIQNNIIQNNQPPIYTEDDVPPLTKQLLNKYYSDAAFIEFSEITKDSVLKETQVYLNLNNVNQYYEDLILIHKKSYLLGNSFFENFLGVFNLQAPVMYMMFATVDSTKAWIQNIINGNNYTGVESIDSLVTNYSVVITNPIPFNEGYMVNIYSNNPYNTYALSNKFHNTNEFISFNPNSLFGDAASINFRTENNFRIYIYRLGWGDCEAGCMNNHYWEISVDESNSVKLLKEYGDPLL